MNVDIVVPNQTRYLGLIGNIAEQIAKELDTGDRDTLAYHLDLVLTEAMANAIEYGCPTDAKQSVRVSLSIDDNTNTLCVQVFDHGQGFDLETVTLPDFADLTERGRGLFFIRSLMDSVEYHKSDAGNVLEMRKKFA